MGTTKPRGRILIVDDQFFIVEYLRVWVETYGFEVCGVAKTAASAIEQALQQKPDVILMDVRLDGDRDGIDAALEICGSLKTRVVYITGSSESPTMARINEDHPFAVLIKPIDPAELQKVLMRAFEGQEPK